MRLIITVFAITLLVGCGKKKEGELSAQDLLDALKISSVSVSFPDELRGKTVYFTITNQRGGSDFGNGFRVPADQGAVRLLMHKEEGGVTVMTKPSRTFIKPFGRSKSEEYPIFSWTSGDKRRLDYRNFKMFFANSPDSLELAKLGKVLRHDEQGNHLYAVIELIEADGNNMPKGWIAQKVASGN